MIIHYNNNERFKYTLEELITMHANFHIDLLEADLYQFLLDAKEKLNIDIQIEPEVNLTQARPHFGWKFSTLRYLSNSDEFSMFLPTAEMLTNKSGAIDIQKDDPSDEVIHMTKTELLRRLKGLEVDIKKLENDIEGGNI